MLEERLPRQPEVNFDILDETLRSEATRTDVVRSLSDPQRDFLLWELKQGCMTSVVNCLPPGERAAFVVCHVLKLARRGRGQEPRHHRERVQGPAVARAQEGRRLPRAALRARQPDEPVPLPGARRHRAAQGLHPPVGRSAARSRCASRPMPYGRYGTGAGNEDVPMRDIAAIYGDLPEPDPPSAAARLGDKLDSGDWETSVEKQDAD